jgi:hypothetical protein
MATEIKEIADLKSVLKDSKEEGSLKAEQKDLNKTTAETYKNMKNDINKQIFELGEEKTELTLDNIVKNFNIGDNTVKVDGKNIIIDWKSDL